MLWVIAAAVVIALLVMGARRSDKPRDGGAPGWLAVVAAVLLLIASLRFGVRALLFAGPLLAWLVVSQMRKAAARPEHESGTPGHARLTRVEALRVLGLKEGASAEEITAAHRNLIKKLHPDQGGSGFLAQQVNEAKAVLLDR